MIELLRLILHVMASLFKPRAKLVAEILTLRQQLNVLRRQVSKRPQLSSGVTTNPTAEWISRQITEAFPWNSSPRYLIRDRDTAYGLVFRQRVRAMGIRDKPTAPRSPWQNPYVERLIGTIRRECLDHLIVFGEAHLRRILGKYA